MRPCVKLEFKIGGVARDWELWKTRPEQGCTAEYDNGDDDDDDDDRSNII